MFLIYFNKRANLQVGSVDHHIHYYDLRKTSHPLHIFSGHQKTVSYVKFLSNDELASASTDNTLRLWDVKRNLPVSYFSFDFFLLISLLQLCNLYLMSNIFRFVPSEVTQMRGTLWVYQ